MARAVFGVALDPARIPARYRVVNDVGAVARAFDKARPAGDAAPARYNAGQLGDAYGRLAGMVLARKLKDESPIWPAERREFVGLAGIPSPFADSELTDLVFMADAHQLGKGGVIGQISSAVSSAVAPVAKVVSSVQKTVDQGLRVAAPIVSAIPGVGPAVSQAMNVMANQGDLFAGSSIKGLVSAVGHPLDTIAKITGTGVGAAGAIAQGLYEGAAALPGQLATGAEWAYQGVSGLIGQGTQVLQSFGGTVWNQIEATNPSLSGELTSLFKGVTSEYAKFSGTFDNWSAALKGSGPGTYFGKLGGNFYSIVKDTAGHFLVKQHDAAVVPGSIASQVQDGTVAPVDANLFAANVTAGSGSQPIGVQGNQRPAAGVSLPGGPNGAAIATDQTSMALIAAAVKEALGIQPTAQGTLRATKAGGAAPAAQLAGIPVWLALGLGAAGLLLVVRGGVQLGPQHRPRYVRGRR